jgi:hypothetical protein
MAIESALAATARQLDAEAAGWTAPHHGGDPSPAIP